MKNHFKIIVPVVVIVIAILSLGLLSSMKSEEIPPVVIIPTITNFNECAAAGNPIMESFPRQCAAGGQTFTEEIKGITDMNDMIRVYSPKINATIQSPLTITGEARGTWFFEATFPIALTNWDGLIIAEGYATANDEWMTNDFVPFTATLTFKKPNFNNRGTLILQKSNPSGLSRNDAALEIPIYFKGVAPQASSTPATSSPEQVFCTADARECPDGTYVGRQPPSCAFAPCPGN